MAFIRPHDFFNDENLLYHYTSADNAVKYILFDKKLRLTPRKESYDPIEKALAPISYPVPDNYYKPSPKILQDYDYLTKTRSNIKQLSFCQSNKLDHKGKWNYDSYGFMKPRMWDQYGDRYKGVCLVFNRSNLNLEPDYKAQEVIYKSFDSIFFKDPLNLEKYKNDLNNENLKEDFYKLFFYKHMDYMHENEFKIITCSNDEYNYIDISNSICSIIVSDLTDYYFIDVLHKYSKELKIPMYLIYWSMGISTIKNYDDILKYHKELNHPWSLSQ